LWKIFTRNVLAGMAGMSGSAAKRSGEHFPDQSGQLPNWFYGFDNMAVHLPGN
jgi:hypothetical protein